MAVAYRERKNAENDTPNLKRNIAVTGPLGSEMPKTEDPKVTAPPPYCCATDVSPVGQSEIFRPKKLPPCIVARLQLTSVPTVRTRYSKKYTRFVYLGVGPTMLMRGTGPLYLLTNTLSCVRHCWRNIFGF